MLKASGHWPQVKRVSVVVDPPGWFTPFGRQLVNRLREAGNTAEFFETQRDVARGDIGLYLSCTGLTPPELLARNAWNIVVHASDLPRGRGFSPLTWQILEGKNKIPLTMIAMADKADAGDILMQYWLEFEGHELNDEMRSRMGGAIQDMCVDLVSSPTAPGRKKQSGDPSWYRRRKPADSELDPTKSLAEQFELLRVVDNERYPAFFDFRGRRYVLKVESGPAPACNGEKDDKP